MNSENAVLAECVECHRLWLPTDREHWEAYLVPLTDDEPPELLFYCPGCAEREFSGD